MRVRSLGREDTLEEAMATHSSGLTWRIPWTEKPGGLQSVGSHIVRHDWSDLACSTHVWEHFWILSSIHLVCLSLLQGHPVLMTAVLLHKFWNQKMRVLQLCSSFSWFFWLFWLPCISRCIFRICVNFCKKREGGHWEFWSGPVESTGQSSECCHLKNPWIWDVFPSI